MDSRLQEFGSHLLKFIGSAIILKPDTDSPRDVLFNGTFSYVDTGSKKLLVTAAHVYDYFMYLRTCDNQYRGQSPFEEEQEVPCVPDDKVEFVWFPAQKQENLQLTGFEPTGRDRQTTDLCTYVCEYPLEQAGKAWCRPQSWPPPRPQVGDQVIGIGFPGRDRRINETGEEAGLHMVALVVSGQVGSCSDRHFVISDEGMERKVFSLTGHESELQFGGMSGGIFFKFLDSSQDEIRLELAGFLYEVYDIHAHGNDQHSNLYVTHADFILPDGGIDPAKLF